MNEKKMEKKTFLGMPMNLDRKGILKTLWNPETDVLFPPKSFGVGWTVNFHAMLRKVGLIKKR